MKSNAQIRKEISDLRRTLRERKRQTLGLPISKRRTYTKDGHEYLVGVLAHTQRRLEIFRNAGGEADWFDENDASTVQEIRPAVCQGCVEPHLIGWEEGQWHHNVKTKGGKRCDCAKCGLFLCAAIHELYRNKVISVIETHNREPQFGTRNVQA